MFAAVLIWHKNCEKFATFLYSWQNLKRSDIWCILMEQAKTLPVGKSRETRIACKCC